MMAESDFEKAEKLFMLEKFDQAKILFENILTAYNVLVNPIQRKRYDQSFLSNAREFSKSNNNTSKHQKKWDFTEEQFKQRQYYKNYYHAKKQTVKQPNKNANYSDYKYILFATPIAVGLLMLILFIFNNEPISENKIENTPAVGSFIESKITSLENGSKPYNGYFGNMKSFETNLTLQINNASQFDAIVVLYRKKNHSYLQHTYLKPNYTVSFSFLPATGVYWKCLFGKNWNSDLLVFNNKIVGSFDSVVQYQNWEKFPIKNLNLIQDEINFISILGATSKYKNQICNDSIFFAK